MAKTGSNQWETVTSKSSKHKQAGNANAKGNKHQKKRVYDVSARTDLGAVIKDTHTMFDPLIQEDLKHKDDTRKRESSNPAASKTNGTVDTGKGKKYQNQQRKKGQEKKKATDQGKPQLLEEVIKELSDEALETLLLTTKTNYSEAPSIWLKDVASYLNVKLPVEVPDPVFSEKRVDYPFCLLSPKIQSILNNMLSECGQKTLQLFLEYCLQSMVQSMVKGHPSLGDRLLLQCLAHLKPALIAENLTKFIELRSSYQNRHHVWLSVLWAAGQAGVSDFKAGLQVWLELMVPVVGMRAFSKFTIEYLENLLKLHPDVKSASEILGVREFFPILDFVYSSSGLPGNSQKQLQALYPKLKALSYGPNPENTLCNYFPSYLRRLSPAQSPLKQELLANLVLCLAQDRHCYSVWRQLYTKHLLQSSILMHHLSNEWENLPTNFPKKLLKETLHTFRVTNEELTSQAKTTQDGFSDCVKFCSELLFKMNSWRFPWRQFLILLFLGLNMWIAYDIWDSGSFQKSKTGMILRETGLLAVCEQAQGKITVYSSKAYVWICNTIPVYYTWLCNICGPYLKLFWSKLFELCTQIWNSSQGLRDWFNTNGPVLLKWVSAVVLEVFTSVQNTSLAVWTFVQQWTLSISRWLQENVLTDSLSAANLQKHAGNAIEAVQQYTVAVVDWCTQQLGSYATASPNKKVGGVP